MQASKVTGGAGPTPLSAAMTKKPPPFLWPYPLIWGISGTVVFILLTYLLATSRHMGSW